ncbi:MAG: molecular chaperone TorD family protein [Desulfobulbaceae bacterium]|nr:molecular chaperone TorD family protein [Desulfobulbaceae bacterium]
MTTTVDQKVRQCNCFKLLAACFYEPEKEMFLRENLCDNLASMFADLGLAAEAKAADRMKKALEEQNDEDLKVEYARLFVGPFELVAPPYGSVYLDGNRMLMGDSTLAVQKVYRDNGLTLEVRELPDHIALELEFMHYLCLREANAEAEENKEEAGRFARTQADFMRKFLGPWIVYFCHAVRKGTDNPFYFHLAECLEGFTVKTTSLPEKAFLTGESGVSHACRVSA